MSSLSYFLVNKVPASVCAVVAMTAADLRVEAHAANLMPVPVAPVTASAINMKVIAETLTLMVLFASLTIKIRTIGIWD